MSSNYMRGLPPIKPPVVQGDTQLPFDPNAQLQGPTDTGDPLQFPPQEQAQRDALQGSQQRMQSALAGQNAPTGNGIMDSPLFQVGAPALLTALSAIFPRHMRTAGPIGESALSNLNYTNIMQGRTQQAQAQGQAQSATNDFNKQRFQYAVTHDPTIDPAEGMAISAEADADMKGAAAHYAVAQQKGQATRAAQAARDAFDPTKMSPNEKVEFEGNGQKTIFGGNEKEATPFAVAYQAAQKDPNFNAQAFVKSWMDQQAGEKPPNEYGDYQKQYLATHPGKGPGDAAAAYKLIVPEDKREQDVGDTKQVLEGMKAGLIPPPLPSPRSGMTPQIMKFYKEAAAEGVNVQKLSTDYLAEVNRVKYMGSEGFQKNLANINSVDGMLDNVQQAYNAWKPYATGLPKTNTLAQNIQMNLPGDAGVAARRLNAVLTETGRSLGQVMQGGGAITDEAANAAKTMLAPNLTEPQFEAVMNAAKTSTGVRKSAYLAAPAMGMNGETPQSQARAATAAPAPTLPDVPQLPKNTLSADQQKRVAEINALPISRKAKVAKIKAEGLGQ